MKKVIIVGAGIFGLSTALSIAQRYPDAKIIVVDRFEPPVPDGSSTDTTRCLRFDYTQKVYADLSKESLDLIVADPELAPLFHRVGMTFAYDGKNDKWGNIWDAQLDVVKSSCAEIKYQNSHFDVFSSIHQTDSPLRGTADASNLKTRWNRGYTNPECGYIEADNAMIVYYKKCLRYSQIQFIFEEVDHIVYTRDNVAQGVQLVCGDFLSAELVIVAAGAWSCKLVDLSKISMSTCIEVGWFKVDDEDEYKNMAITTNLSTGINIFPPLRGEIKVLRRSAGFCNSVEVLHPNPSKAQKNEKQIISYPRTFISNPKDWMPLEAEKEIRENLKEIMPELAEREFDRTKVCWITQSSDANFLIDFYPDVSGVFLATCGSAHAWKFLPIIGNKVVDRIEDRLQPDLKKLWSWDNKLDRGPDLGSAPRMSGEPLEMERVMRSGPKNQSIIREIK